MNKYVFGPVPSRRLGFSLGVDAIRSKYCSFDCIYCQIGKTTHLTMERESFFDPMEVVEEVIDRAGKAVRVDFITFSGSGEPTLNRDLGFMIREVKKRTSIPVAVITNGSLLCREDVRTDLLDADVVMPSLDAASDDIFHYIDRPHPLIELNSIVSGLKEFRSVYHGQIWLEVMMVAGVNDEPEELAKFKEIMEELRVDRIQLNTVTRPPSEDIEGTMSMEALEKIAFYFGERCEVICTFEKSIDSEDQAATWEERVLAILGRRSMNLDDIVKVTGISYLEAKNRLHRLELQGDVKSYYFGEDIFYVKPGQ